MKRKYQLLLIVGMFCITSIMLVMIFVKHFNAENIEQTPQIDDPEKQIEIVFEENTDNSKEENQTDESKIEVKFVTSDKTYFDDALFIGDSRTVGLCEYGDLKNADYFSTVGMSIYKLWKEEVSVENIGRVTLQKLLEVKDYKKIYIMLGINELGYEETKTIQKYQETLSTLKKLEPDAIIYVCANLHVTKERSEKDDMINNSKIDSFNQKLEELTDPESIYYININEKFDDESGNLRAECSNDNVHVAAKYYKEWSLWLCENTIQRGNEGV